MEDRPDIGKTTEVVEEITGVDVVREFQRGEVLPFVGLVHAVDDQDVIMAKFIQPPHDRTADESGTAGNYDLHV